MAIAQPIAGGLNRKRGRIGLFSLILRSPTRRTWRLIKGTLRKAIDEPVNININNVFQA